MPSLKGHIELSVKRTGKEHREVHEWMDGRDVGYRDRFARHRVANVPKFLPIVERLFGEDGAREYLQHIKDDYDKDILLKILRKMRSSIFDEKKLEEYMADRVEKTDLKS